MNLLQAGVSLEIIRDFLSHEGLLTTQIYARANLEMKREALEKGIIYLPNTAVHVSIVT